MRLIDADKLKSVFNYLCEQKNVGTITLEAVEAIIDTAPTVPQWIPCSRDLPKNNNPVNITWINHNPEVYYMDIKEKPFTATAHYHNGHWYWYSSVTQDYLDEYGVWTLDLVDKDVEIIAWMPLPEPYKGVTDDRF